MAKAWIIARREYLVNIRRPAFLFAAFGVPLFSIVLMAIIFAVAFDSETNTGRIGTVGYVDEAGVLAAEVNKPDSFAALANEDAARAALMAGQIGAYFVLPPDYVERGDVMVYSVSGVPDALESQIDGYLIANLGASLGDGALVARIQQPLNIRIHTLDNNRTLDESAVPGLFITPFLFVSVLLFASQITSGYLMSGVVEEKTNRILEMLLTSITPFQMLFGKLIGLGALGLTQLLIWLAGGVLVARLERGIDALSAVSLPPDMIAVGLVYFVLNYLLFSSIMAGIGAVIGSEQESRQYAGILSLPMALPFIFIVTFFTDPDGTIPLILTLVPFTSAITVILRMSFASVPAWQLVASMVLLLAATAVVVWGSARVFRWSLLMYGKRPGVRQIWRALRRAPEYGTSGGQRA